MGREEDVKKTCQGPRANGQRQVKQLGVKQSFRAFEILKDL